MARISFIQELVYESLLKGDKALSILFPDLNRNDGELHALINFGELRRKLSGVAMQKQKQKWRKLTELINSG